MDKRLCRAATEEKIMIDIGSKNIRRQRRHERARKRMAGTAESPRLNVFRSLNHIYAQLIDDAAGATLLAVSSKTRDLGLGNGGNVAAAQAVGHAVAERALAKGIQRVIFDRGGYAYHGRVKALADAAREAGLQF